MTLPPLRTLAVSALVIIFAAVAGSWFKERSETREDKFAYLAFMRLKNKDLSPLPAKVFDWMTCDDVELRMHAAVTIVCVGIEKEGGLRELGRLLECESLSVTSKYALVSLISECRQWARPCVPQLITLLSHPDDNLRIGVIQTLGRISDNPQTAKELSKLLRDPNPSISVFAATALWRMGPVASMEAPLVIKSLDRNDPEYLKVAIQTLGKIKGYPVETISALLGLLGHERSDLRRMAILSIGEFDDARNFAEELVSHALIEPDLEVASRMLELFSSWGEDGRAPLEAISRRGELRLSLEAAKRLEQSKR